MLGTAGGMYHFRDQIRAGNPTAFFVLNGDVCSDFSLIDLYDFHKTRNGRAEVTLISKRKRKGRFSLNKYFDSFFHVYLDYDNEHRSNKAAIGSLWLLGG